MSDDNPTISAVLAPFIEATMVEGNDVDWAAVEAAIQEREDSLRDQLQMAGLQFGLYPFIVSEVLATVGLGTPPSEDERAMIHRNYITGMEDLQRQYREGQGG